ncbi:glycosyl transferase family 2 [Methylobacterium sp. 4-46]|uniref:glycosyltransferase n=1 Tax=unclassified Methylobacterium TaxID=2615210 RepID=UPI000152DA10|nr:MULTISPECIES: glycosyltransferase [Methylobacterium]ACA20523.1 glycosyl transferase family 2 [Methylobacterium sp. 4-46]WFT79689.1 glycosyltransferase [Methylobacterium nodulans]
MLRWLRSPRKLSVRVHFDERFYRLRYPDVGVAGADPFAHYMSFGWKEGRDPSPSFPTLLYKDKHLGPTPRTNPLAHYAARPEAERQRAVAFSAEEAVAIQARVVRDHFDEAFYRDAARLDAGADALTHYLTVGWREGYEPAPGFSSAAHAGKHRHIAATGLCPFYHFVSTYGLLDHPEPLEAALACGASGGRARVSRPVVLSTIAQEFDRASYLTRYADVRQSGIDPVEHYVDFGWKEGRDPSEWFWTGFYREEQAPHLGDAVNPFYHYLTEGRPAGLLPNPFGCGEWPPLEAPRADEWDAARPAADLAAAEVVVIVPVYKGRAETLRAIHAVLSSRQTTSFALVVVDDCGPEPQLRAALQALAARKFLILVENAENLGFVRSVNRGIAASGDRDVILLNSDAVPSGDWIDRLRAHARANPDAATLTPLSNNATICSYPQANIDNRLALEIGPAEIDACARACNPGRAVEVPTGVGFCFYIRGEALARIGPFDAETFGHGYGEENDFCMRAKQAGYRNLLVQDVFVYHAGGVSFSTAYIDNAPRIERRLSLKHPDYFGAVQRFIAADPGREGRMRLDLYRIARQAGPRAALFVTHERGGGIETHVRDAAARLAGEGVPVVLLRVAGHSTVKVEFAPESRRAVLTCSCDAIHVLRHAASLESFLGWLQPLFVHVHSLVGLEWRATRRLMEILAPLPRRYVTLHDYSPVCHRNDLVTRLGTYCGLPGVETCRGCLAADHDDPDCVDPDERRSAYAAFVAGAEAVFAPSRDIAARIGPLLPGARIALRPHAETLTPRPLPALRRGEVLRVAVVGAIGPHKGVALLHSLGLDARLRDLQIRYAVVGYTSMTDRLSEIGVTETGRYRSPDEAMDLLEAEGADVVLIPSIWPETYCYALSIALAAGLPPLVFDLGAPAERLRARQEGLLLDPALIERPQEVNDRLLDLPLAELYARRRPYPSLSYGSMLTEYYGLKAEEVSPAQPSRGAARRA